jgi:hypothetical protein
MPLWTDLIDPVEASGIAREEQYAIEQAKGGTLARFLPNVFVDSDHVEFYPSSTGLVDAARYRAFNARPEIGKGRGLSKKIVSLPAISRNEPIDELTQKDLARLSDERVRKSIEATIRRTVQAISQTQERARGKAIDAGVLLVDEDNFYINDVFGRDASLSVSAGVGNWWADAAVDRLTALSTWQDLYASFNNGTAPGRLVFGSRAAYNAYAAGDQFTTNVGAAASRPPLADEVRSYTASAGLPDYEIYERSVMYEGTLTKVLDAKKIYFLPEPTDTANEDGSELGATYWGRTVSAGFASWGIEPDEQPGIVCGVFRDEKVGSSIEVEGDSIGEPVLANPNASMAIQVLA